MKKDIDIRKVTDIAIAVVPTDEEMWDVYLINLKSEPIRNILVSTKGYGTRYGEPVETNQMRYFIECAESMSAVKIEPIQTDLFDLANQYWISFQHDNFLFDKKYVFVAGSLNKDYFTRLPILDTLGIMIK